MLHIFGQSFREVITRLKIHRNWKYTLHFNYIVKAKLDKINYLLVTENSY